MLKKRYLFLIVIICLFAISAVSATDNATSDIISIQETTDDVVSVFENNSDIGPFGGEIDILTANSDGTFTDLANDIANANGEFKLTKNYVYDSSTDSNYKNGIVIDKEITINGRGFVINGDNKARAFNVQYGNVILRNMEFINCSSSSSSSGGAVYWNGVNGSLFDCNFVNCYSSGSSSGGAVYWNGVNGSLFDCNFVNCYSSGSSSGPDSDSRSDFGGAVYWNGVNGNLFNCIFNNCYKSCSYPHSSYSDNVYSYSYSYGGAVYWNGVNGSLFDCNFVNCYSYSYCKSTSSSYSLSYSCYSYSYGGTYWEGKNGRLSDCIFINSTSSDSSNSGYNSYRYNSYTTYYARSYCYSYGGAVYWKGDEGNLFDCNFITSTSNSGSGSGSGSGGAVYWQGTGGNIINSSFINCHVPNNGLGSAVYWYGNDGGLLNCSFINSTSTFTSNLGYNAIYWEGKDGEFFNSSFDGNYHAYEQYCNKADTSTVCPIILIYTYSLKNDDRIVVFESTQLTNNISVELYNVTDRKILYDKFNISSDDLTTSYTVNNLEESEYQIYLTYGGDKFFTATSQNDLFKIGKNSSLEVSIGDCVAGGNVTINVTLNEDATGKIKFTLSDYIIINDLENGKTSFYVPYVSDGVNNYKIKYGGDDKYNPIYLEDSFEAIAKLNSSICLDLNENYTFDESIALNYDITPNCTGIISIFVDDVFKANISVGEVFELENIDAGEHNIAVIYNGDDYFSTSNDSAIITVLKAIPSINVNYYNLGSAVLFEVILNEKATGNIALTINNKSYSKALINAKANITVTDLAQGNYIANIAYGGDNNYDSSNTTVNVLINKLNTVFYAPDVSVGYGDGELVAVLSDVNGYPVVGADVFVVLDNVEYSLVTGSNGQVSVSTADLAPGSYVASIAYEGDDNYNPSSTTANVLVNKVDTIISASDVVVGYGDGELVAVLSDVNGYPVVGADVFVVLDNAEYSLVSGSDGSVSVSTADLAPGSYVASIAYEGDDNYNPSSTTANVLVNKLDTIISVSDVVVGYGDGELVAVLSDVNGYPVVGADVFVVLGNAEYSLVTGSDGRVSVSTADLAPGSYVASINYDGDETYNPSSASAKVTVKTKVDISAGYNADSMEIVAALTNAANGMAIGGVDVQVNVSGETTTVKTNSKGKITVSVADLAPGQYSAVFSYDGNSRYNSASTTLDFSVDKMGTVLTVPDVSLAYKDPNGELVVTIADEYGNPLVVDLDVNFNGKDYAVGTDSDGRASISIGTLSPGTYAATVSYGGSGNYKASTETAKVTVTKADTIISASDVSLAYKDSSGELVASIVSEHGKPLAVTLNFNLNGKDYSVRTDSNGEASIAIGTLSPGKYTATVSYKGSSNYKASTETAKVTVTKADTIISASDVSLAYKDPNGELVATIISEHGKPLVVKLNVELNGKTYTVKTDSNGQASIPIGTLSPGKYSATVSYKGSSNYKASSTTALVTVTKAGTVISASDVSLAYKDPNGELVATIVSEHGKALVVTLNVNLNGKDYSVRTDSDGQASISIGTLSPGTYTATISYKGSANYKASTATAKVTVTKADTVISASDVSFAYKDPNGELVATIVSEHGKPLVVTLNVNLNGKDYSVRTDSNGQASIPLGTLTPGTYTATISYKGSANYKASTTTAKVTVTKAGTIITAPDVSVEYGDANGKLVSTITNEHGKPLVVNLNVELNGKTYSAKTDSNGQISVLTADLASGTYSATISYKGSSNYEASTTTANIQVKK